MLHHVPQPCIKFECNLRLALIVHPIAMNMQGTKGVSVVAKYQLVSHDQQLLGSILCVNRELWLVHKKVISTTDMYKECNNCGVLMQAAIATCVHREADYWHYNETVEAETCRLTSAVMLGKGCR